MSIFEKLKELFNCKYCSNILQDPVILPCGETICKKHSEDITKMKCLVCSDIHSMSKHGFPVNAFAQSQLDIKLYKLNINSRDFQECNLKLENLNKKMKKYESMRNDKENYIYEYFSELRRNVDIRRDTLINNI
jgi:hypothetical protein